MDREELAEFMRTLHFSEEAIENLIAYLDHEEQNEALPEIANQDDPIDGSPVVQVGHDFLYAVADQRHLTRRPKRKWYTTNTTIGDTTGSSRLTKKRGICFHHTAVAGGFGTHKSVRRDFEQQLGLRPGRGVLAQCEILKTNRDLDPEELVRLHALGARYRGDGPRGNHNQGIPYHVVRGPNSVLYLNLPFDWVTWHGNGANTHYLGFGWDAKSTVDSPEPEDMIQDILYLAELMVAEGHTVEEFKVHSQYTNKPKDPWKHYIEKVMYPAAERIGGVVIDVDFRGAKKGKTIAQTLAS